MLKHALVFTTYVVGLAHAQSVISLQLPTQQLTVSNSSVLDPNDLSHTWYMYVANSVVSFSLFCSIFSLILARQQWKKYNTPTTRSTHDMWTIFIAMALVDFVTAVIYQISYFRTVVINPPTVIPYLCSAEGFFMEWLELISIFLSPMVSLTIYLRTGESHLHDGDDSQLLLNPSRLNTNRFSAGFAILTTVVVTFFISTAFLVIGAYLPSGATWCWIGDPDPWKNYVYQMLGEYVWRLIALTGHLVFIRKMASKNRFQRSVNVDPHLARSNFRYRLFVFIITSSWILPSVHRMVPWSLFSPDTADILSQIHIAFAEITGFTNFVGFVIISDLFEWV